SGSGRDGYSSREYGQEARGAERWGGWESDQDRGARQGSEEWGGGRYASRDPHEDERGRQGSARGGDAYYERQSYPGGRGWNERSPQESSADERSYRSGQDYDDDYSLEQASRRFSNDYEEGGTDAYGRGRGFREGGRA